MSRRPDWLAISRIAVVLLYWSSVGLLACCGQLLPTAIPEATPSERYDVQALNATAQAIASVLPLPSANPELPPNKAASFQQNDLRERSLRTAVVLYPPPPGYYAPDLYT